MIGQQHFHSQAFDLISQALICDEQTHTSSSSHNLILFITSLINTFYFLQGDKAVAIDLYRQGIAVLEQGISLNINHVKNKEAHDRAMRLLF